jgi:predicted unusual protein kinase regulating ubiquinone biosynthesis (AarF/ABC1/UbiB family)
MSAITEIGLAKMKAFSEMQGKSSPQPNPPAPVAEEPPANPWALRSRAFKALWFGAKMIAGFIWWELILAKFVGQERVAAGRMDRFIQLARSFRALAIDLGGVWIKLGQFLSSRVDLIPPQIIVELQGLQDDVPAEPASVMLPVIARELQWHIDEVFEEFDPLPVAAASFGQAYLATLRSTAEKSEIQNPKSEIPQRVVVKVQRPNLNAIVSTDLRSLKTIAGWLKFYKPIRRRANLDALVKEFS